MSTAAVPADDPGRRARRQAALRALAQLAPVLLLYAVFLVLPYAATVAISFFRPHPTLIVVPDFSFAAYARILTDVFFLRVAGWTVLIGVVVVLLTLLLGYPMAWRIVRSSPRVKGALLAVVLSPLLVNLVVRTYAWQATLGENGVVNGALIALGLVAEPVPLDRNLFAVIIGLTQITLPFMVLSLVGVMETLDRNLLEAAEGLGSSPWRSFAEVVWPLTLPGVGAGAVLVFSYCTSAFVTPALLGGGRVATIATQIYQQFLYSLNWPVGAALVVLLLVMNIAFVLLIGLLTRRA